MLAAIFRHYNVAPKLDWKRDHWNNLGQAWCDFFMGAKSHGKCFLEGQFKGIYDGSSFYFFLFGSKPKYLCTLVNFAYSKNVCTFLRAG